MHVCFSLMLFYFAIVLCRNIGLTSLFLLHPELLCIAVLWCVGACVRACESA